MYKRVLLKLGGEVFSGTKKIGIDKEALTYISNEIYSIPENIQLAILVGGGNIFRGGIDSKPLGIDRVIGDQVGMLSTVINALILQNILEKMNKTVRVMSAIQIADFVEPYIRRRAIRHLEKGRIVVFASGIGNPHFTTDTAAVLRAIEIKADVILKGTKVDGVYTADPINDKSAKLYKRISYSEFLNKKLKVMDLTSVTLCWENNLPIIVFNITKKGNLKNIIEGKDVGTIIS